MSLQSLLEIGDVHAYKLHVARYNGEQHPLDVFTSDREEWHGWNRWISARNELNRQYVLALIDDYAARDCWLFGGIYEVRGFLPGKDARSRHCHAYDSVLTDIGGDYVGRLRIRVPVKARGRVFNLETFIHAMTVEEVLPQPYSGRPFPGYANVTLSWNELRSIVANNLPGWKTALSSVHGIYMITLADGRHYVGSAGGNGGVWARWAAYAATRHGGNRDIRQLDEQTNGAFLKGARFTLIEASLAALDDAALLVRESYWKRALGSRAYGLNAN